MAPNAIENSDAVTAVGVTVGPRRILGLLEKTASIGTVIKTLIGFVASIILASVAVYQHFAKTSDLDALKCSVVDQSDINNQVIRTAQEVRTALNALKANLDTPSASSASTRALSDELSRAIGNIQTALDKIDDARAKIQAESIKGERKC